LLRDGLSIILTPNASSLPFNIFGKYWSAATPDEHNLFLSPRSIEILAEEHDFDVSIICNTNRHFSILRGLLSEIYRSRKANKADTKEFHTMANNSQNTGKVARNKIDFALDLINRFESPILTMIHRFLNQSCRSDELLCVLKKR
jgi:hypothetical protein